MIPQNAFDIPCNVKLNIDLLSKCACHLTKTIYIHNHTHSNSLVNSPEDVLVVPDYCIFIYFVPTDDRWLDLSE